MIFPLSLTPLLMTIHQDDNHFQCLWRLFKIFCQNNTSGCIFTFCYYFYYKSEINLKIVNYRIGQFWSRSRRCLKNRPQCNSIISFTRQKGLSSLIEHGKKTLATLWLTLLPAVFCWNPNLDPVWAILAASKCNIV